MFKRPTSLHSAVATTLVSALFVSLSAHAGLLGIGSTVATGAAGSVVGNAGPAHMSGAGMAASQAATQARVQSTFTPHMPPPAITPPTPAFDSSSTQQIANQVRTSGEFAADQAMATETQASGAATHAAVTAGNRAASAVPRKVSASADASSTGTVQASGRNSSVNSNTSTSAQGSVNY